MALVAESGVIPRQNRLRLETYLGRKRSLSSGFIVLWNALVFLLLVVLAGTPGRCFAASAEAARTVKERFDIRGVIEPPDQREANRFGKFASIRLSSATSPYADSARSDLAGQFRFKKVPAGIYTLDAFGRAGSARLTVEVSKEAADQSSRGIRLRVPLRIRQGELRAHLKRRFEVSARTLSIPEKAFKEYEAAEKRVQKDDYPGAIEKLERAVTLAPQYTAAWNRLGIIAFHQKQLTDAERYFRRGMENNPEAWDSRLRLGQVLIMQGRAAEALPITEEAVKLRPSDAGAHSQLAMTYVELKDYEKAVEHLSEAKRLEPGHASEPQLWLARIYAAQKNYPAALREVEEFVAAHPQASDTTELRKWLTNVRAKNTSSPDAPPQPR